jgi:hypothetical protein
MNCLHLIIFYLLILQGKRGIEKPPFQLPDFIAATGIEKIRQVMQSHMFAYVMILCLSGHPQKETFQENMVCIIYLQN